MKTLVVFYSLEGNTKFIADVIAKHLQADTLELKTAKPFPIKGFKKFFKGGMSVVFKQKPKLDNKDIDLNPYDNIIIGTPVWAGSYSSPVNSFIKQYPFTGKKVGVFLCSGGGGVEKCCSNIKKALPGNSFIGEIDFVEPLKRGREEAFKASVQWCENLSL